MVECKTVWVGTSWKMNKGPAKALEAARTLAHCQPPAGIQPFVIPPFTSLHGVCDILKGSRFLVGAQNMHWEENGAWTGEVSPLMVKECGASLVEIGHSERREHFGETDWTVNLKVRAAIRHGLRPLICIGDTLKEYDFGVSHETLVRQLKIALHGLTPDELSCVLIAYEPVWAIGAKGRAAEAEFVSEIHTRLRAVLVEMTDPVAAARIPLLYGGSVTADNAASYVALEDVDGVFIGRAAWEPADLENIIGLVSAAVSGENRARRVAA